MNFELNEESKLLRDSFDSWLKRELLPLEEKEGISQDNPPSRELASQIRKQSAELGFYTHHMPEEVGGGGLSITDTVVLKEVAGKSGSLLADIALSGPEGPSRMHMVFNEAQRDKYLAPLMKGDTTCCFMLSEPGAGSDAQAITTTAEKRGDVYVLNGTKHFITNGPHADWGIVFALTDREKRARGGISAFVVDRTSYKVARQHQGMAGFEGQAEIVFEDSEIPAENLVGKDGWGFAEAMGFLGNGRLEIAAGAVGVAQYLLDMGTEYAKDRVTFGKPIAERQGIQWMIADSATELYAARQMVYHCAWLVDQGRDASQQLSMCKLFATEMVNRVCDRVLQIHGGMGWMRECKTEAFYRSLRVLRIVEGTSELQRMMIARAELAK